MPWEYLFEYKVVVCTCTTAGQLLEFEQPLLVRSANLFTHLFIDEVPISSSLYIFLRLIFEDLSFLLFDFVLFS